MAWSIISHQSAPASNQFDFSSLTLSGYQRLVLMLDGLVVGTDGAFIQLRLKIAGSEISTSYRWHHRVHSSSSTIESTNTQTGTFVPLIYGSASDWGIGNAAGKSGSAMVQISNPTAALYKTMTVDSVVNAKTGSIVRAIGGGSLDNTGSMNGLRVYPSTGTLTAGKATLYGLNTA
ncbi:hypothetical protein [Croceicoccus sp. BE223]|uniref:hypothetical protein n=1 Tax=Croceicoccus sp. BE223 TaxID=2817716 RepID=UPI002863BB6A|nr:hypothetical protein [Croceicoccus sp. BE223]MDR7101535.1 hypothetical protein [Croceicoccus sp. BE223]